MSSILSFSPNKVRLWLLRFSLRLLISSFHYLGCFVVRTTWICVCMFAFLVMFYFVSGDLSVIRWFCFQGLVVIRWLLSGSFQARRLCISSLYQVLYFGFYVNKIFSVKKNILFPFFT
ncbi:unnamed protein product [Brassica napus]|uniref:(rape) hypothetical protein n=1 Tax=Brassica napus TaxID=3708 RepID=A0A816TSH1_BRANA|nr:unnamed protein product [Brassica napus]